MAARRYMPWGEERYSFGSMPTTYLYSGQRWEASLGLSFFNARWYDSALGRFISADTIVPLASQGVQAWDRYSGLNNNPVRYSDPTGHDVCDEDGNCYDQGKQTKLAPQDRHVEPGKDTTSPEVDWDLRHAMYLFRVLNRTMGWWNNFEPGSMTPMDFLILVLAKELNALEGATPENKLLVKGELASGSSIMDFENDLSHGTSHWFYSQSVLDGYGKVASDGALMNFAAKLECSGNLYDDLILQGNPDGDALHPSNCYMALASSIVKNVVNPPDREWTITGLVYADKISSPPSHPIWWGNPGLMGKPAPTSYFWMFGTGISAWYLVGDGSP